MSTTGGRANNARHHDTVYNNPVVTNIDTSANYQADISTDGGHTWNAESRYGTVCGGHVQVEAASALLSDGQARADGPVVTVQNLGGGLIRWTPTQPEGNVR